MLPSRSRTRLAVPAFPDPYAGIVTIGPALGSLRTGSTPGGP